MRSVDLQICVHEMDVGKVALQNWRKFIDLFLHQSRTSTCLFSNSTCFSVTNSLIL